MLTHAHKSFSVFYLSSFKSILTWMLGFNPTYQSDSQDSELAQLLKNAPVALKKKPLQHFLVHPMSYLFLGRGEPPL